VHEGRKTELFQDRARIPGHVRRWRAGSSSALGPKPAGVAYDGRSHGERNSSMGGCPGEPDGRVGIAKGTGSVIRDHHRPRRRGWASEGGGMIFRDQMAAGARRRRGRCPKTGKYCGNAPLCTTRGLPPTGDADGVTRKRAGDGERCNTRRDERRHTTDLASEGPMAFGPREGRKRRG